MFLGDKNKINKKRTFALNALTAVLLACGTLCVHHYVALSQASPAVLSQNINIYPGEVSGNGWSNLEGLQVQDVGEYGIFQDFSTENAAYILPSGSTTTSSVPSVASSSQSIISGAASQQSATSSESLSAVESSTTPVINEASTTENTNSSTTLFFDGANDISLEHGTGTATSAITTSDEITIDIVSTSTATTSTLLNADNSSTTSGTEQSSTTSDEEIKTPSALQKIIDVISNVVNPQTSTTSHQESAVIQAGEDNATTTPSATDTGSTTNIELETTTVAPDSTASSTNSTSTVGVLWGMIKHLFTTFAVAEEGTTTDSEASTTPAATAITVEPGDSSTTPSIDPSASTTADDATESSTKKGIGTETLSTTTENVAPITFPGTTTKISIEPASNDINNVPEDITPPVIEVLGKNPAHVAIGSAYNDLGAVITNDDDKDLGIKTYVDGVLQSHVSIDTNISDRHVIRYVVTDQAGNTGYAERILVVGEELFASLSSAELTPESGSIATGEGAKETSFCDATYCDRRELTFENFGLSDAYTGKTVRNIQLRLSLAGRPQTTNQDQKEGLVIDYYYGGQWEHAGSIVLDDEVSNALNGGYYLFALPLLGDIKNLDGLKVRVAYETNRKTTGSVFIDGLWVEVAVPEERPTESKPQVYKRNLRTPSVNEFLTSLQDFSGEDIPTFHLQYHKQRNIAVQFLRNIFSTKQFEVVSAKLVHPTLGEIGATFDVTYGENNEWTLKLRGPIHKLPPGKYTVKLKIKEGSVEYDDSFDFYYGVLAVNTNKATYVRGEDAYIQIAALDDGGNTLCDADLRLMVEDPLGDTTDVPVSQSGNCGANNVTSIPDYLAHYTPQNIGTYTMHLTHLDASGNIINEANSSFSVDLPENIPFTIERIGPTRIYPPSTYTMTIKVTSKDAYKGKVVERLPKGFVLSNIDGAGEGTFADYKTLTWNADLKAGETKIYTYTFDAPDVSPYLYLLGPLTIGTYMENRTWQIASDAVTFVAWLTGTQTTVGTNLNNGTTAAFVWSTSTLDTQYFDHSTSTNPERLTVKKAGDYLFSVTMPVERTGGSNNNRSRIQLDLWVNGVRQDVGVGRSSYIRGVNSNHFESSSHLNVLIPNLSPDDYVELGVTGVSDTTETATTTQGSMYAEYIGSSETVFTGYATSTTANTNLNDPTASPLVWLDDRVNSGYTHDNGTNPEQITLDSAGDYLIFVNIPLSGAVTRGNVVGRVLLNSSEVSGGEFKQGYIRNTDGDTTASIHWSGVISASASDVLTVTTEQDATAQSGTIDVGTDNATIYVQKLPSSDIYLGEATTLVGPSNNWNPASKTSILWTTDDIIDSGTYTHSTSANAEQITVAQDGNYLLVYNDAFSASSQRPSPRITVEVNGTVVPGAITATHYIRDSGGTHQQSSGSLTFLLTDLTNGDIITVSAQQDGSSGTVNDDVPALLMLWRKPTYDAPPDAPTLDDVPFDNEKLASTTPWFEFTGSDPDGTSDITYQISWSTSTDFTASTTRTSDVDSGFEDLVTSDTDPFNEDEKIRFTVQAGDALSSGATYYWRVRAKDVNGSNSYSDWTTTKSITVSPGVTPSKWFQTKSGQFDTDTFSGAEASSTLDAIALAAGFTDGYATSSVIDFNWVSDQPSWGGILWNATEPSGASVLLHVGYADVASTTCEAIIPDSDLSGNGAGFDVSSASTIDLSGLSTTTYSRLCLSASFSATDASPSLDDWTVSWVLDPILTQYQYLWYVNENLLTPTDIWPSGSAAIAENEAIGSAQAPQSGDVLRLRMNLSDSLTALGTSSEQFRLQYASFAEGASCSASLSWNNVGAAGSGTIWRGYANSLTAMDWYNEDWPHRIAITIDHTQVDSDLTDFPVYINLADLGSGFFSHLNSDGGDIRVTEDDGTTEVPREVVSASTTAETGELYFKAPNISSSSDTTFYIYYGDSGASDYADSATYGRDNVWTNGFEAVYHMEEDPGGSAPQMVDSTGNGHDDTTHNMDSSNQTTGKIEYGVHHDGGTEYTQGAGFTNLGTSNMAYSVSSWFNADVSETAGNLLHVSSNSGGTGWCLPMLSIGGSVIRATSWTGGEVDAVGTTPISQGSWEQGYATWDSSNGLNVYLNGAFEDNATQATFSASGASDYVSTGLSPGSCAGNQGYFAGGIDEVRIENVHRNADWISATYRNQATSTDFYAASPEDSIGDGQTLSSTVLSGSTLPESYEEENDSAYNPYRLTTSDVGEWDWVLEDNAAATNTSYCFRMVDSTGGVLGSYSDYPTLITNAAPNAPTLKTPFDNEQLASTTPWFEFTGVDDRGDDITYEVQVDNDADFSSPFIDKNSSSNPTQFTDLVNTADKDPFTSGNRIRFVPTTSLSDNTTYWWRVRGKDPNGTGDWGSWSSAQSITVDTSTSITTWFQTTEAQFDTDMLTGVETSGTDIVQLISGSTTGSIYSPAIDFSWNSGENAWGGLSWNDNETAGDITYHIEYYTSTSSWALIPDSDLSGNSTGFDTSSVSLTGLDSDTYGILRIYGDFTDSGGSPVLNDWTVTWGNRIAKPTLHSPFDNEKFETTTPSFIFTTTDPEDDELTYEISWSTDSTFTSSTTKDSSVDTGFSDITSGDTDPFISGDTIKYMIQPVDALSSGTTYWWRVRARDPAGSNQYSFWSDAQSFTTATSGESINVSTWYQTTEEQFDTDTLTGTQASTSNSVEVLSTKGNIAIYREATGGDNITTTAFDQDWDTTVRADPAYTLSGSDIELKQGHYLVMYGSRFDSTGGSNRSEIQSGLVLDGTELPIGWSQGYIRRGSGANDAFTSGGGIINVDTNGDALNLETFRTDINSGSTVERTANASGINLLKLDDSWAYIRLSKTSSQTGPTDTTWVPVTYDRQDELDGESFSHTSGSSDVTLKQSGHYLVFANTYGAIQTNDRSVIAQRLTLNGADIDGSYTSVYVRGNQNGESTYEGATSIGMIIEATTTNEVLNIEVSRVSGTTAWTIDNDDTGTYVDRTGLTIVKLPDSADYIRLRDSGTDDMNPATLTPMGWDTEDEVDVGSFTHSVVTNDSRMQVTTDGDYLFMGGLYAQAAGVVRAVTNQGWTQNVGSLTQYGQTGGYNRASGSADDVGNWSGIIFDGMTMGDYVEMESQQLGAGGTVAADFKGVEGVRIASLFTDSGADSGTVVSTPITFTDGTGPLWGSLSWNDTAPSGTSVVYQVEYYTSTSSWALIPDAVIPGNSSGTSTSPINLRGLNISTYGTIRLVATLTCSLSATCPMLDDWTVEWAEGITVSGSAYDYDGISSTTAGTVAVAVNGTLQSGKNGTINNGSWSIDNVTMFAGDTVTVFITGASDDARAVGVTKYGGSSDIGDMTLIARHVFIGSDQNATTTNVDLSLYDNSVSADPDVFYDVDASNDLYATSTGSGYNDVGLYIQSGDQYRPDSSGSGNVILGGDLTLDGELIADSNTISLGGSWDNNGAFSADTGTVLFTATSTTETIDLTGAATSTFYNLTFGQTSGSATWDLSSALDVDGALTVNYGTLSPGANTINIASNLSFGANGLFVKGSATTTFDGSGTSNWTDSTVGQDLGTVVIDGTAKTVRLGSNVAATDVTIGADDTLDANGSNTITVYGDWANNHTFTPSTGTVAFAATTSGKTVNNNSSGFYNLTFNGVGGSWSFLTNTISVNHNFTAATGTVTLPTATTTVGGSFDASTGYFAHNNGTIQFNGTGAGKTITLGTDNFLNNFYNVTFNGSGSTWTFTDTNATTSGDTRITAGTVTLPSGTYSAGGSFDTTGGAFSAGDGIVYFNTDTDQHTISTNGSSFATLLFRDTGSGGGASWYDLLWPHRIAITIDHTQVDSDLTDFPVYINLADLGSGFFSHLNSDGGDIRVTEDDGTTEVPREVVSASTTAETGELYFKAPNISSSSDTTFYIYYGDSGASDYADSATYGRDNVWTNGFEAVYHMEEDPGGSAPQMVDSTGNGHDATVGSMDSSNQVSGEIGNAVSADGIADYVVGPGFSDLGTSNQAYSMGIWFNADVGETDGNIIGMSISSPPNGWRIPPIALNGDHVQAISWTGAQSTALGTTSITHSAWNQTYTTWDSSNGLSIYLNGAEDSHVAQGNYSASGGSNYLHFARTITGGAGDEGYFAGSLDEIRIYNQYVDSNWISTEYRNIATTTDFYATSSPEGFVRWTFTGSNATTTHDFTIDSGQVTMPSDTLAIGGSFTNTPAGTFNNASGTVRFYATTTGNTINPSGSLFDNVIIDAPGGGITLTGDATTTDDLTIVRADDLTVQGGVTMEVDGTFSNALTSASTTWSGSTLYLNSGTSYTINTKGSGDSYGTILLGSGTNVRMWGSEGADAVIAASGSSLYSQDNADVDGDLYIYGDYTHSSGTDYWSYATDFDGVSLSGGNERQVSVYIAPLATTTYSNATLEIIGSSTATTTIDHQGSGTYGLLVASSTLNAAYYSFKNLDGQGLTLASSTIITSLDNGAFELNIDGGSMLSISTSTIDANSAKQIYAVSFATSSGVTSGYNVTETGGTATSYLWFRNHYGNYDGETFDSDSGSPGEIRWDDSVTSITVSGNVYGSDRSTPIGNPPCDGSTAVVRVLVDGGGDFTGSCNAGTGAYSVSGVTFLGDVTLTTYLDTGGGARAVAITRTPTGDINNMNLYEDYVIVRHEDITGITIADLALYDGDDDSDIPYTAATGSPDTLTLEPNTGLYIWPGKTFAPGGNMILESGGSGEVQDGSLIAGTSTTLTFTGTEDHHIGGSFIMSNSTDFDAASSTLTFTATTTGKIIAATSTLDSLIFNGTGGGWTLASSTTVVTDMTMTAGTVSSSQNITVKGGDVTGDGVLSLSGGIFTLYPGGSLGGNSNWTFYDLYLGDGVTAATTTKIGSGSVSVFGTLTIGANQTLDAGISDWTLAGSGTPFVINGSFNASSTLFSYTGTGGTNVKTTTYNNLILAATGGSPTYTIGNGTFTVGGDLTIGDDTNAVTVTADTNDPTVTVTGDLTIKHNATLVGSSVQTLTLDGSWIDQGAYTHSNGTVMFAATTTGHTIEASSSPFFNVTVDGTNGGWTVTEHATATNNFDLNNASAFTVSPGATLEVGGQFSNGVGGAATTWTGSTLYLDSGTNYAIDTKTAGGDSYGTLSVGPNTDIRMWNSTSTTYVVDPTGSLYSEDHNATDGDLYIFGDYVRTSGNDYWSYATDFDGTDLSGGSERQANVFLAQNATATLSAGTLSVIGVPSASTTIQNQGTGTYSLAISGGTFNASDYQIRDIDATGLHFTGAPTVTGISRGDFLLETNGGSMMTVTGSVIDANTGKTFTGNIFATSSGVSSGYNVTVPDTSIGSWRFTTYGGNYGGESYDNDPTGPSGDPGYIIWDDSNSQITISGHVYLDEGNTPLGGATCNGSNQSVQLRVEGAGTFESTCDPGTGAYSISGITYSPGDSIIVYLDADNGATVRAANVTVDPATSISNMDLYQDRVIVRHEDVDPLTIADMATFDSSDDSDIPFTAVTGSPDTLTLPPGTELHIWAGKTFAPGGNVTLDSGGVGSADGTLHVGANGSFTAAGTESHSIGGSLIMKSGATLTPANSTITFTATTSGKIITATSSDFYNLAFNGSGGAWSFPPNVLTVEHDLSITSGDVTLPSATTTVGGSFTNTGGTFLHNNGLVYLTATAAGQTIQAGNSSFYNLTFDGSGGAWTFTDTNATTSNDLTIEVGSTTLPSGTFAVGGSFANTGGTFTTLSGSTQRFTSVGTETVYGNGSSFGNLTFDGSGGDFTFIDQDATSTGSVIIQNGHVSLATGTLAVAQSFDNEGGTFTSGATTTIYLYGSTAGQTINANGSLFTNLTVDGSGSGGWTLTGDATTTNNLSLLYADSFTASGFIEVDGMFTNLVGGASTTWSGSTLYLNSGTNYSINTKTAGGDAYATLTLGTSATSTDIRMWDSTSTIYTTNGTSSIYSQDHDGVDGALYIWGGYERDSGTDYWSYATDFDGTTLSGANRRAVDVRLNGNATTTYSSATLNVIGASGATTTVDNQGSGIYGLVVGDRSTLDAQYYQLRHMSGPGLSISGASTTVTSLSYGDLELSEDGGSLVTVASTTIDNNPTLTIDTIRLATSTGISGYNFSRDATSTNAWTITNDYGSITGEAFDDDGYDECGSFRFSDSACLFVNQVHYRWRNDDGGEGVPDTSWYDQSFTKRKKITITDTSGSAHTDVPVELSVAYDADMQTDFNDLRFTDSSGTTSIDHWIQSYVDSDSSTVWVRVPSLPASGSTYIYMYYSSSTAPDAGVGTTTFDTFDNFEDDNITEYSGDTSLFDTNSSFNYERSYGLSASAGHELSFTTTGIYRTDTTISQGETVRYFQYVDMTSGSDDEACTLFGVRTSPSYGNYAVCFEPYNTDHISISKDVASNDTSGTILASKDVTFTTGWYEVYVDWLTDNSIDVNVYKGGSFFASTTATDSSYTSGGFGFSYWGQHGGWDLLSTGAYVSSAPSYSFGYEQTDSGASWLEDEDTAATSVEAGDPLRLRFSVNNTGADITNQDFRLQIASKGGLASCESVSSASYSDVPTATGGCGSSAACMATSTYFSNLASTTELLSVPSGSTFAYGQIVKDPSNETGDVDVHQNEFTELEYAFNLTNSAIDDAYCFRVTNAGTALDNYSRVAEATLLHPPTITNYTLNGAQDIALSPGTTTTVYATGTAIDLNGYADLAYATATVYRTSLGAACSPDDNDCYDVASTSCSFSACAGNSCELSCQLDMAFFADPTDSGAYAGDDWTADITVYDNEDQSDTGITLGVDVLTLRALTASSSISYGSLSVGSDTGSSNQITTVENQGNSAIDIALSGTNLTYGASSIPVSDQKYATSTFTYSSCGSLCLTLSTTSTAIGVNMEKPTTTVPVISQNVFWGLYVPTGVAAATHSGTNTFTAISP